MTRLLAQLSHLSKYMGANLLFDDISVSINEGESFALVGENGSGKTTLLRLLEGSIVPDEGKVQRASNLTIGYLPQEIVVAHGEMSVKDYLEESPLKRTSAGDGSMFKQPRPSHRMGPAA